MPKAAPLRLGVNVDHVATLRNARGGLRPDPLRAAQVAIAAGECAAPAPELLEVEHADAGFRAQHVQMMAQPFPVAAVIVHHPQAKYYAVRGEGNR